eukprot:sb/3477269/
MVFICHPFPTSCSKRRCEFSCGDCYQALSVFALSMVAVVRGENALRAGEDLNPVYCFSTTSIVCITEREGDKAGARRVGKNQEQTETSMCSTQPIRTRYLGHVTGDQPK